MGIETKALIAIDMDDVLCQTNMSVAEWHNETYGTDMSLDRFYCKSHPILTPETYIITSAMARLSLLEGMTRKKFSAHRLLTVQESVLGNRTSSVSKDAGVLLFPALYKRSTRSRRCASSSRPPRCGLPVDDRDRTQQKWVYTNRAMDR
jgi:hypothetical protein